MGRRSITSPEKEQTDQGHRPDRTLKKPREGAFGRKRANEITQSTDVFEKLTGEPWAMQGTGRDGRL